jgi:hypothetical protein
MPYILVEIDSGGYIRSEVQEFEIDYFDGGKKIVHKESVDMDKWDGLRVFDTLAAAKTEWSGPESDEAILSLNDLGGGENIWIAERQADRLTTRLKIWSGCYGGWKVKKLNA